MKQSIRHTNLSPYDPNRVVILGASGFIGKKLVQQLSHRNIPVLGISSRDMDLTVEGSVQALCSILRPSDSVVLASAITPDRGKDVSVFMNNLKMGTHVGTAVASVDVRHFIYLSTDAVFAEDLPPIDESVLPTPTTLYGLMHLARERMMATFLEGATTAYLIIRPCALYGRGDTHGSYGPNRFVKSALEQKTIRLFGQGEEHRPHMHIDDFLAVLIETLLFRTAGLLHVIEANSLTFLELAQAIAQKAGPGIRLEFTPRTGSATHKFYLDRQLREAFPELRFRPILEGVQDLFEELLDARQEQNKL